eukprot:8945512-Alexandrium_andersonii.AAC.1
MVERGLGEEGTGPPEDCRLSAAVPTPGFQRRGGQAVFISCNNGEELQLVADGPHLLVTPAAGGRSPKLSQHTCAPKPRLGIIPA